MKKVIAVIAGELREAIFPTLFFLAMFHLIAVIKVLLLKSYGISAGSIALATIGALIVAKAILIADKLPFVRWFDDRILLVSVAWKTMIFGVLVIIFRCIEEFVPVLSKYDGPVAAAAHFREEISWPFFWATLIWLFVALVLYISLTELNRFFGAGSLKKAFLGK